MIIKSIYCPMCKGDLDLHCYLDRTLCTMVYRIQCCNNYCNYWVILDRNAFQMYMETANNSMRGQTENPKNPKNPKKPKNKTAWLEID